jgi:hypothetical protein
LDGGFTWRTGVGTSAPTEKMRITSAGDVGIGTTSPSVPLHVVGNGLFTGTLEVDTVNNGVGDFLTRTAGGIITRRTAAEVRTDIGAQAALNQSCNRNRSSGPSIFLEWNNNTNRQ